MTQRLSDVQDLRWNYNPEEHGRLPSNSQIRSVSTGWAHRGKKQVQLPRRSPPSTLQTAAALPSTHTAGTFLWGLAAAARESDGVGTCQELFSRPHDTDSAKPWEHLGGHGKERQRREINSSSNSEKQRLAATDRHRCSLPTSQF